MIESQAQEIGMDDLQEKKDHRSPLRRQGTTRTKVKYHFEQLRNLFLLDALIFILSLVFLALFALGVVSLTKLLFFTLPFLCVFLSTLFFFGYIVWFDNGFKGDEEYTLEELRELEVGYLSKGGYRIGQKVNQKMLTETPITNNLNAGENRERELVLNPFDEDFVASPRETAQKKKQHDLGQNNGSNARFESPARKIGGGFEVDGARESDLTLIDRLKNFTSPKKTPRPEHETRWENMTPKEKLEHHRRAVRDRNEELEILAYAIYTRLFFTVISFAISIILIPYTWEQVRNFEDKQNSSKSLTAAQKNDPLFIDWSIVFPEDYEPKFQLHKGILILVIIGAVLSFMLIIVGVKMHQFYNQLKEDVRKLNLFEVQLVTDHSSEEK